MVQEQEEFHGYSVNSSDTYKNKPGLTNNEYRDINTSVNINISGGTIKGDIYGGGFGYTEYLTIDTTPKDAGALYGNSNINISGSPTINGNIYAAGRGATGSSLSNLASKKPNLAQVEGDTHITISGTPKITGEIYGGGEGVKNYSNMAKLNGNSYITISGNLNTNLYGGGNIAKTKGLTIITITDGTHTKDIYGGGNVGEVEGKSYIYIKGGNSNNVYGGGSQIGIIDSSQKLNGGDCSTNIFVSGGNTTNIYGGSNISGNVPTSYIETTAGTVENIYGGNNAGGTTITPKIVTNGGTIENIYGGGNMADTPEKSNITINNGEITNAFGGANKANVPNTNVEVNGGQIKNIYGGSNQSGTVNQSNINIKGGNIDSAYGGNNLGGKTTKTKVTIFENNDIVNNVFGGGNRATTDSPQVIVNGNVKNSVFGGGNQADITTNTNVEIGKATIGGNVYGGGNEGGVLGNTYVHIKDSNISGSAYAGGNGVNATVNKNAKINIDGTTTNITKSVFGGGNQAKTGSQDSNNSNSIVNIVGATIGGNVYGGANTSKVYGKTYTNIGYNTVKDSTINQNYNDAEDSSLEIGNIIINGTVFGGGEANASGSEIYDFEYISVTKGILININAKEHAEFHIKGSIFGSGNASSSQGESIIKIKDYGSVYEPQDNISIQRADVVTIDNSAIYLSGTTDRTNELSTMKYSLSRIDDLKLKNNSILYLSYGANLLKKYESLVGEDGKEEKATVTIDEETGKITQTNVDNRIYMAEGRNLIIANKERPMTGDYGEVYGMTFFGMFTNFINPSTSTGIYNKEYKNGDQIINEGTVSSNSYVMAKNKENHDLTQDGFYSNFEDEENEKHIKIKLIDAELIDPTCYMWLIGKELEVTTFEVSLIASKYATLGTYELALMGFSTPNTKFLLTGFSAGLAEGIELIEPNLINMIEPDQETADNKFGLSMKTGNTGWTTKGSTTFITQNGGTYMGTTAYNSENAESVPTLNLCLYHSENISVAKPLGSTKIRLQAQIPVDELNYQFAYIDIDITLETKLYQDNSYEAAISPGQEFNLFATTETNITDSSAFSTYYSLFIQNFVNNNEEKENKINSQDYFNTYKHALESRNSKGEAFAFPKNTKITLIDMVTHKYYYYVVTEDDEINKKNVYKLEDFVAMGSDNSYYNERENCQKYYNTDQDILYESFIFQVNFEESNIASDIKNNTLLMEIRDEDEETLISVLGSQRDTLAYSVYKDKDATIKVSASTNKDVVYLGDNFTLSIATDFKQNKINSKTIYDTHFFDNKMGVKISIFDSQGNRLNSDSLLGVSFSLDNVKYYPRIDGTVRINTADKVSNVLSRIVIDTADNTVLATGDYTIKIESFGSPDGIYYGIKSSDTAEVKITIIESSYGLKVYTDDNSKIINKDTGHTQDNSSLLTANIEYSSGLENPSIAVALYRRDYSNTYSQNYELVDLSDYLSISLTPTKNDKEYLITNTPQATMKFFFNLGTDLVTGTYKLVFKLYDNGEYIGETYEYLIIK